MHDDELLDNSITNEEMPEQSSQKLDDEQMYVRPSDSAMSKFREEHKEIMELYEEDAQFLTLLNILKGTVGSFAMNRVLMQKIIDSSWVEAIEKGLIHLDNVLRNPRRTIEDVEEIVPIALSRKITVESVKHLAQHTDLIQSIDEKTGKITPSKILNIHKEESLMTYENKFVNTLIDRLYTFITLRYEKLAQVEKDGEVYSLGFNTLIEDSQGGTIKIDLHIENEHSLEKRERSGYTVWQRVTKLKRAIEGYKGSELCQTLGNTYIRPPVMRTNAIMKNVDLKACLTLWQYIESYDKVGYEINIENSAVNPSSEFINDFYELVGLHMLLFRASVSPDQEVLETKQLDPIAPKILKQFDDESAKFDFGAGGGVGYISQSGDQELKIDLPEDAMEIIEQVGIAIEIEQAYREDLRRKLLEAQKAAEEEERRRLEEERIEEERQKELARIEAEKAEQERQIQEMLEKARIAQEEAERERQKLEAERLALLEEKRQKEEAEKARLEEERKQRELEEAEERERQRIAQEKKLVRSELGAASGIDTEEQEKEKDKEEEEKKKAAAAAQEKEEDPQEVIRRAKEEQQRREKERAESERARKLNEYRLYFESKPFEEIRREYTKDPIWVIVRLIRHILVIWFGIIPENTDRPDYKHKREEIIAKREQMQKEKEERQKMEFFYKKYGQTFKYRTLRDIDDIKFKRKKKKQMKGKPKPTYQSKLTPEQQAEVQAKMRALYKEYHVSLFERMRRLFNSEITKFRAWRSELEPIDKEAAMRAANVAIIVLTAAAIAFSIYVSACTMLGKPVNVFGYSVLKVETGSMEPALHVDDYIVIKRCDPQALHRNDIISFYSEQEDIKGMLVTHRIVSINNDGTFVTHGDANPINDEVPVKPEKVLGVYVRKSGFYIWLGSFADTNKLFLLFVMLPLTLISIYELRSMIQITKEVHEESEEEAEKKAKENYERRMREAIDAEKKRLAEENYQGNAPPQQWQEDWSYDQSDEIIEDFDEELSSIIGDTTDDWFKPDEQSLMPKRREAADLSDLRMEHPSEEDSNIWQSEPFDEDIPEQATDREAAQVGEQFEYQSDGQFEEALSQNDEVNKP